MVASTWAWQHHRVPIVTFRRPIARALAPDPGAQDRELAYLFLIPVLAGANLLLGLTLLVLCHHEGGWKAALLLLSGALLCAVGGWLVGVAWLRLMWRSRMDRQMRLWTGVVDTVTGWDGEPGVSAAAALRLKRRLEDLVSRF